MKHLFHKLHLYFFPHEDNNFHAKTLHINTLTVYLVAVLAVGLIMGRLHNHQGQVLGYATDITTQKLFELTNKERVGDSLSKLTYNDKLASAASEKARNMFAQNYWAHYGPDGTTPWQFILGAGYEYSYAGENLAKNFLFSGDVVTAWMDSPSHRHNLLRPEYTDVGFAVVNGLLNGEETTLVVQMFGTPQKDDVTKIALVPSQQPNQNLQGAEIEPNLKTTQPIINFLPYVVNVNYAVIALFILVLLIDFYVTTKFHIRRLSGKNLAHFIFIVFMAIGIFIITKGKVL